METYKTRIPDCGPPLEEKVDEEDEAEFEVVVSEAEAEAEED